MAQLDLIVLAAYLAGILAVGVLAGRRHRSADDLVTAGRAVPGWAVGLSIFGTYVSSISFLALPAKAYAGDWNAFVFSLAIPPAAWLAVRYFVPFYRSSQSPSAYEHLEGRFGPWARNYAVACYLLTQIARQGTIMYLLALALSPLTGWSIPGVVLLTGVLVIAYTLYGGISAVIWTDVVQSVVFIVGSIACVAVVIAGMPHGASQLFDVAVAHRKFSLGSFGGSVSTSTVWVVLLYGFVINLQNFGIDQNYIQRYQTAKSTGDARQSVWVGALLYVPISAVFFFIGTGLFAYYDAQPARLPAGLGLTPDLVFPHFIVHELPIGLVGLVIAALFAAAQSTVSTSINSSATLLLCDIYQRYVNRDPTERQRRLVLRVASLLIGVLGTGAALAMMRIRSALDTWWLLAGVFGGGMLGLFLLGRVPWVGSRQAARGVVAAVLVILWMTFSPRLTGAWATLRSPFDSNLIIVVGTLVVLVVGIGRRSR